jgi:hypothetical protein
MLRRAFVPLAIILAACSDGSSSEGPVPDASDAPEDAGVPLEATAPTVDAASSSPEPSTDASVAGGAASADAGAAADAEGGPPCITAGTELCDDFESGQIDPARWMTPKPSSGVTVTLDSQRAHSGRFAVHVHGVAGGQNKGLLTESVTFPAKDNSFYARIFAYFSPDLPAADGGDFHTGFIFGSGNNDKGSVETGMGLIGGDRQYLGYSIFYGSPSYEFGPWSNTRVAPNRWICMELFEDGSSPATEKRRVWVDGAELTDLRSDSATAAGSANPNHASPSYDLLSVGLGEFHPSPSLTDMWFDDVRVSAEPIGCE